MNKDTFFAKPVYEGKYEPIFKFQELGDVDNYWIQLKYRVNRDDYQTVKHNRGDALDFGLRNQDGELIFGEIPEKHLLELKGRGYVLGAQSPEVANEEGTEFVVSETYVYAPKNADGTPKTYDVYDSDIVPVWAIEDPDMATKYPILIGKTGHKFENQFYKRTVIRVSDAEQSLQTGDAVVCKVKIGYIITTGIMGIPAFVPAGYAQTGKLIVKRIVRLMGTSDALVELDQPAGFVEDKAFTGGDTMYGVDPNLLVERMNGYKFFLKAGMNPQTSAFPIATGSYMLRAYSHRAFEQRRRPIVERVRFYCGELPKQAEIFTPKLQTGTALDTISRESTPTPAEWKRKVASSDFAFGWFNYAETEIAYDRENDIYEAREKLTKCI